MVVEMMHNALHELIILLIPGSLCWMTAGSESFVLEYKPLNAARECGVTFFLRTLCQGLCNQHLVIQWCDCSLLVTTTKRSRRYIDSPFQQVMR
jgi:hypothetical protein